MHSIQYYMICYNGFARLIPSFAPLLSSMFLVAFVAKASSTSNPRTKPVPTNALLDVSPWKYGIASRLATDIGVISGPGRDAHIRLVPVHFRAAKKHSHFA